jgi:cytochrome c oxidase subunit 2
MIGIQSAVDPAGPQSARIYNLGVVFTIVCVAVYVITLLFVFIAVIKSRRRPLAPRIDDRTERRLSIAVSTGAGLTIVILIGLLVASVATGRGVGRFATDKPLEIVVTGHQWWWEINYTDPESDKSFHTANEIHVPTGRQVLVRLATHDVIHSLWIPNLAGKLDLIPGRVNKLLLQADRAGVYRGQCAEYCGMQHANMALVVVAERPEEFERWKTHQQTPAPDPQTEGERRGQQAFLRLPCVNCHAITGTDAYASLGPDLTHLASRRTLAAGTIGNSRDNLARWIVNAPAIKPGNQMPPNVMSGEELRDLVAYLESLR